jgi:hypothetical protein
MVGNGIILPPPAHGRDRVLGMPARVRTSVSHTR